MKVKWLSGIEDIVYDINPNEQLDIIEGSTLSLTEQTDSRFKIYPNPAKDVIHINGSEAILQIAIINQLGQTVYRNRPQTLDTKVDISGLSDGVYIVRVISYRASESIQIIKD